MRASDAGRKILTGPPGDRVRAPVGTRPGFRQPRAAARVRAYASLAWLGEGRRLAFVVGLADPAEDTNDQNIWMWDATTNRTRQLTRSPKNDYSPAFSRTGDTLAFVTVRGTGDDVKPAIWFLP